MAGNRKRLHLGCGPNVIDGWLNIDGSWSAWFASHQRIGWVLAALLNIPKRLVGCFYPENITMHDLR